MYMDSPDQTQTLDVLKNVRALRPFIEQRAAAIEAEREVPQDLINDLRRCGVFRMYTPKTHGGLELDLPDSLEVITELATADGSVGWISMIGSATPLLLCGLSRRVFDAVHAEAPDVIHAGSTVPAGIAERVEGGYRVSGRWPFASGCQHADWMLGVCVVSENGTPVSGPAPGVPLTRVVLGPARDWQIEDTWRVAGMKGTGSHHIVLRDHFVSEDFVYEMPTRTPCVDNAYFRKIAPLIPLTHAALALGIAEGARGDLLAMARSGRRQLRAASSMGDSPVFQYELARADADVRSARAYLQAQSRKVWNLARQSLLSNKVHGPESSQVGVWVTDTCRRAVDAFYGLAGGPVLYESSPLQRRLRDMRGATQHVQVQLRNYEMIGQALIARQTGKTNESS